MGDQEIISNLKARDERMLKICYTSFYRKAYRVLRDRFRYDVPTFNEIFQDSIIALWRNTAKEEFVLTCKLSTYIIAIALRLSLKHMDRKVRYVDKEETFWSGLNGEADEMEDSTIRNERIAKCLGCVSLACQRILKLYYFDELSLDQIAERLNLKGRNSAKTLKYKCMQKLRSVVRERYVESDFEPERSNAYEDFIKIG